MKHSKKIIIIGAGVAGLTLALACQAQGLQVKLFDKAKTLRGIGGGILLWPHAVRYLEALGLLPLLQDQLITAKNTSMLGRRGNLLLQEPLADIYALLGGGIHPMERSILQERFVNALTPTTLTLNKTCAGIENKTDYAEVFFTDGTRESADIVVGADGVHSALRHLLFPSREPQYAGFCWWGGIVENHHVPAFAAEDVTYQFGINMNCSIWPVAGERFMWYLPVKMPLNTFSPEVGIEQAKALTAHCHPDITRLVHAPQTEQSFHVPIFESAPMTELFHGRTVLIGDAACTFGPLLGQGVNKAIEDAFMLATLLKTSTLPIPLLLQRYQQLRHTRHQRFYELEHMAAAALIQENETMLTELEAALPDMTLVSMYQDVIPLANLTAHQQLLNDLHSSPDHASPIRDVLNPV